MHVVEGVWHSSECRLRARVPSAGTGELRGMFEGRHDERQPCRHRIHEKRDSEALYSEQAHVQAETCLEQN